MAVISNGISIFKLVQNGLLRYIKNIYGLYILGYI